MNSVSSHGKSDHAVYFAGLYNSKSSANYVAGGIKEVGKYDHVDVVTLREGEDLSDCEFERRTREHDVFAHSAGAAAVLARSSELLNCLNAMHLIASPNANGSYVNFVAKQRRFLQIRDEHQKDFVKNDNATKKETGGKDEDVLWNTGYLFRWNSPVRRFNTLGTIARKIDLGKVAVAAAYMSEDAYYPATDGDACMAKNLQIPYILLPGQHDRINYDTVAMIKEYFEKLQAAYAELRR